MQNAKFHVPSDCASRLSKLMEGDTQTKHELEVDHPHILNDEATRAISHLDQRRQEFTAA